jgi:hypothetical protein
VKPRVTNPTRRSGLRRAFTLVELVTATSLMTIMMLGVVQIFAIITQTAGDAQGIQFAQEQARAVFDVLHRDLRGIDRVNGYLRIVTLPNTTSAVAASAMSTTAYATDLLALESVGPTMGCWHKQTSGGSTDAAHPYPESSASEIVYTRNVLTDTARLQVAVPGQTSVTVDERRGILGRGQWLIIPPRGGTSKDANDYSCGWFPADFATTNNVAKYHTRVDDQYGSKTLTVAPVTYLLGASSYQTLLADSPSLRRVAASCTSEFLIEYLTYVISSGTGSYQWVRCDFRSGPGVFAFNPKALRITVAIHDPDDRKPLASGAGRFRGYAMQEVFWLGDP